MGVLGDRAPLKQKAQCDLRGSLKQTVHSGLWDPGSDFMEPLSGFYRECHALVCNHKDHRATCGRCQGEQISPNLVSTMRPLGIGRTRGRKEREIGEMSHVRSWTVHLARCPSLAGLTGSQHRVPADLKGGARLDGRVQMS